MTIDKELEGLFQKSDIDVIVQKIEEMKGEIDGLVVIMQLKGDEKRDGDVHLLTSDGTNRADANWLLDIGKDVLMNDYIDEGYEDEA